MDAVAVPTADARALPRARLEAATARATAGDVAGAASVLHDTLGGAEPVSPDDRTALLQALIGYLITASRHKDALERARELEAHLGISRAPSWWVDVLAVVVRLFPRIRPGGLFARALGWGVRAWSLRRGATMEAVRAVQLAVFWHDIRACRQLALLQIALSRSEHDVLRALAWLGYSYGYAGARRGVSLLRIALAQAHAAKDEATLVEGYPLLAIAYQMVNRPARALHYHERFLRLYGDKSTFYKLLSHTNVLVALLSLRRFGDLKAQLAPCFAQSFALEASRHHLQIYGVNAVLMAAEGHGAEAQKALGLAQLAAKSNDNPLDWTIFLRLAALTYVLCGEHEQAGRCADEGLLRCEAYGGARWYERELHELRAIARAPTGMTTYRARLLEGTTAYLAAEVRRQREETADWKLSQLAEQLAEALRSNVEFDPSQPPTVDGLRAKLARTFKTDYVVFERDLPALKARVLRDQGIAQLNLSTESNGELRFVCAGGRFFLGLECSRTSEYREHLAAGILLEGLDALSESLVKAAFRLVLSQYVFVHSIRISRDIQAKQQRAAAIGTLAQMLAHDVRRPFRMIRAAIEVLQRAHDPEDFRRQAALVLPEVELATGTADGLIADVMEFSTGATEAHREVVLPEAILGAALFETLRSYPTADVRFEYDLAHDGAVEVDPKKVQRVMSNIIANAVQAMDHRGCLTFSTSQVVDGGRPFVAMIIANDGPPIPEGDHASLFDPFFTRNKPSGTGLGLAIAHRVITGHGGTIECVAMRGRGAAFRFTLPAVARPRKLPSAPALPSHSEEITSGAAPCPRTSSPPPPSVGPKDQNDPKLPVVAIVDDSRAFLMGWQTALAGSAAAHLFTSPEAFWQAVEEGPDLLTRLEAVVTDYRFGNSRQTGVSFARVLKRRRPNLPVFMSSSGYVSRREIEGVIDMELDKEAVSWSALSAALGAAGRQGNKRLDGRAG
jgi:signal transduction histidine kinase